MPMKIIINNTTYTEIKDLSYDIQADVTGSEVVINQLSATIITDDNIVIGQWIELKDDSNNLWAKYWLTDCDRHDEMSWKIEASSPLILIDQKRMPAVKYTNASLSSVLSEIFGSIPYYVDSSFSAPVDGYAPEQSARERLQWVCFCAGAYVKTFFNDRVQILPVEEDFTIIPPSKTFYKPTEEYNDYVTSIIIRAYSYTAGTPETTDKYVTVEESGQEVYYIETTQDIRINNPNVPVSVPANEMEFTTCKLVNVDNVDDIASRLSTYYFERLEASADIINNGEYYPANDYIINVGETSLLRGYIKSCSFSFGLQAKSKIKISSARAINGVLCQIKYYYGNLLIKTQSYYFPEEYDFEVQTIYVDLRMDGHRYIFIPATDTASGDSGTEGTTVNVNCDIALDQYEGVLTVLSVDDVDESSGVVQIG